MPEAGCVRQTDQGVAQSAGSAETLATSVTSTEAAADNGDAPGRGLRERLRLPRGFVAFQGRVLVVVEVEVFVHPQVFAHVPQRLLRDGEFAQVVSPGVVAGAAPGVAFAHDRADRAVFLASGKRLSGDLEGDALAGLP